MGGLSHTVSGDIASFRTPSRVPIESMKFHFLPKQAAGTPSPENPIPIEGWTGLNGGRCHKNLIKPYHTKSTSTRGLLITPTTNGVRVTGTATAEYPIRLSSQDVRFLDLGKKYTFSLYINGDISGCKDPYLGYHTGETYRSIQNLDQSNNYKFTWTVPDVYANAPAPWLDMYIRVKEGSTVDFEIGLQMEEGSNATDYEPYSEEQISITFPDGETIYGGYYDPVAGEIVCDWFKYKCTGNESLTKWYLYGSTNNIAARIPFSICGGRYEDGAFNAKCNLEESVSNIQMYYGYRTHGICISNGGYVTIQVDGITTLNDMSEWLAENKPEIVFKANNPIHIPIPAEDMKAFLDHNNLWSDTNDITEVTYAVTESKDILATRKKAMDFNHAHHKNVKWNNFVNGYLSSDDWRDRDSNDTTTTFENGVSETTFLTKKRTFYTMRSKNEPRVYLSHKYLAYAEYSFDESFSQLPQIGFEFGGGKKTYGTPISLGDGWYYSRGIVSGNINGGGYMYIPFLLVNSETDSGQKVKTRNVLYIDLTLMFGEGKEPATSNEFLKLCEINGINIHEPHSKDITGTDQWWIIP